MSGGHFNYHQHYIRDIVDEIEHLIENNDSTEKDEWGCDLGHHYSEKVIAKFKEAHYILSLAEEMAQRVDWLVSGDDGPESFHRRWEENIDRIEAKFKDKYRHRDATDAPTEEDDANCWCCPNCGCEDTSFDRTISVLPDGREYGMGDFCSRCGLPVEESP